MDTLDLKKLDKLLILCHKRGVTSIKLNGIEFTLDRNNQVPTKKRSKIVTTKDDSIVSANVVPTQEQLLFWSSDLANDSVAV